MLLGRPSSQLISIEAQPIILNDKTVLLRGKSGLKIGVNFSFEDKQSRQTFKESKNVILV